MLGEDPPRYELRLVSKSGATPSAAGPLTLQEQACWRCSGGLEPPGLEPPGRPDRVAPSGF